MPKTPQAGGCSEDSEGPGGRRLLCPGGQEEPERVPAFSQDRTRVPSVAGMGAIPL